MQPMTTQRADEFFDQWRPLPLDSGSNCPPDQVLALAAKDECPHEWASHVLGCKQCGCVIETLRAAAQSPKSRLTEFIEMARKEAEKAVPNRRLKLLTALHTFTFASPARQVAFVTGIIAITLMITWPIITKKDIFGRGNYSATTTLLKMDKYGKALQLLQTTFEDTASQQTSDPKIIARRRELDALIRDLDTEALDPSKLAQLNNTIVASNADWIRSQASFASAPMVVNTRYSAKLSDFYLAWGLSSRFNRFWENGKTGEQLSAQERAEAIRSATEQIQVIRIEGDPDQPTFVTQDQIQTWDPTKTNELARTVEAFATRSNATIRFQNGPFAHVKFPARP